MNIKLISHNLFTSFYASFHPLLQTKISTDISSTNTSTAITGAIPSIQIVQKLKIGIKHHAITVCCVLLMNSSHAIAVSNLTIEPNLNDANISEVTLYANQAVLTKTFSAKVKSGTQSIILENMPNDLVFESIRVQQKWLNNPEKSNATNSIAIEPRLTNIQLRPHRYQETEEIKTLRQKIVEQLRLQAKNDLEVERIQNRITFIESFIKNSAAQPANTSRLTRDDLEIVAQLSEELNQLKLSLIEKSVPTENTKNFEIDSANTENIDNENIQDEDIDTANSLRSPELIELETQLGEAISRFEKRQNQLILEYEIPELEQAEGQLGIEVNYAVNSVTWHPFYEVRSEGDKQSLSYFAMVEQNTGEDWHNINIRLSTATADVNYPYPLTPRLVDSYIPETPKSKNLYGQAREQLFHERADFELRMADVEANERARMAPISTVDAQGVNVLFNIQQPISITGHNGSRRVLIQDIPLANTLIREITPQHGFDVALFSKGTNDSSYPLLAGQANIFIDNQFVRSTSIETTLPSDEINLFLGNDPNIVIQRAAPARFTEKSRSKTVITETSRVLINNLHDKPIALVVHESVPSSVNKNISVEILKMPDWLKPFNEELASQSESANEYGEQNSELGDKSEVSETDGLYKVTDKVASETMTLEQSRGLLKGTVQLAPKTEQSYELKYRVSYPQKARLVGF